MTRIISKGQHLNIIISKHQHQHYQQGPAPVYHNQQASARRATISFKAAINQGGDTAIQTTSTLFGKRGSSRLCLDSIRTSPPGNQQHVTRTNLKHLKRSRKKAGTEIVHTASIHKKAIWKKAQLTSVLGPNKDQQPWEPTARNKNQLGTKERH